MSKYRVICSINMRSDSFSDPTSIWYQLQIDWICEVQTPVLFFERMDSISL